MELYFLRHGDAVPDGARPLSERGRAEVRQVLERLHETGFAADSILTSPLLRARQTADIAAEVLDIEPQTEGKLDAGATLADLARLLAELGADGDDADPAVKVLLVGHEPDFSTMIEQLIGGGDIDMKKAAVARVDCNNIAPGGGVLRWLVTPKLLGA